MSRQVRDRFEYTEGSKWFSDWHRDQLDDEAAAIDLDLVGYCKRCRSPLYLVEATRANGRKTAYVLEDLARRLCAPALVVYQDKTGAHPGEILLDDRTTGRNHGWLPESMVWSFLQSIRENHQCTTTAKPRHYPRQATEAPTTRRVSDE